MKTSNQKNTVALLNSTLILAVLLALPMQLLAFDLEPTTHSNTSTPCRDLVKECFVVSGFERDACFQASGTHPFCRGSDLADLLLMRWEYSPSRQSDFEITPSNAPDLQQSNTHCLASIDNKLAAMLFAGTLSHKSIGNLTDELSNCRDQLLIDLVRP